MMLAAAHYDNVEPFCISPCVAKIVDIYDADTVTVALKLEGNIVRMPVRITDWTPRKFDRNDPIHCVF